jgi:TPR repeat protein
MNSTELKAGDVLQGGTYRIESAIGADDFGITYRARNTRLNLVYDVKEFFISGYCTRNAGDKTVSLTGLDETVYEKCREKFIDEAQSLTRLNHPGIVKVVDVFAENNTAYMVMSCIEGETLQKIVRQQGKLSYDTAADYIAQLSEATGYVHEKNVLHRDLKPDNIIITPDNRAILVNFGAAREFVHDKIHSRTSIHTQGYTPLEQYVGKERKETLSDVYSLGAVTYFVLTGQIPMNATTRTLEKMPEPKTLVPAIPDAANRAILKAMQLKPENRLQTAQEFMNNLLETKAEKKMRVSKSKSAGTEQTGQKSKPVWKKIAAVLAGIVVVLLSVFIINKVYEHNTQKYYATGEKYFEEKNYEEAVKWYRKSAEREYALAQGKLGLMYVNGYGVTQDYEEALKWYRKSAEQGNADAQYILGIAYQNGYGVTQDYEEAVNWYRKSAEQGNAYGQCNLGSMYANGNGVTQDYEEAVKWYRKSAEQGDANAQYNLGNMYYYGYGVTRNYKEAIKWYRKSAEQGYAGGQCNLGVMYENGHGVQRDYEEAVNLYRKSAEQGEAQAQCNLGVMYENGRGVTQDYEEAVKWYRKSAEQGDAYGQCNLGFMYYNGYGVQRDYKEAENWFRKSAEQGNARGQCNLGLMYYNGDEVRRDYTEAKKWFRKSAEQGNETAQYYLSIMY